MSHINTIAEAKLSLSFTEQMVSRLEQSQWAYKDIAADELRYKQDGLVEFIADCEEGESDFDASEFTSDILDLKKDIAFADRQLLKSDYIEQMEQIGWDAEDASEGEEAVIYWYKNYPFCEGKVYRLYLHLDKQVTLLTYDYKDESVVELTETFPTYEQFLDKYFQD